MNSSFILGISILFVLAGIVFCILSFFIKNSKYMKDDKSLIGKISGTVFFIIGFITVILGVLGIAYHKEATRVVVQFCILFYLFILMVMLFIFTIMVGKGNKKK